jgi:predicted small integral membrane protein
LVGQDEGRRLLRRLSVDERIILKCILRKSCLDVDWIGLAQDKDLWWAHVNKVMRLQVP